MRLSSKYTLKHREGETRIVTKFLLFPRCFGGQTRWLEKADIVEEVKKIDVGGSMEWGNYAWRWHEIAFAGELPRDLDGCAGVWKEEV